MVSITIQAVKLKNKKKGIYLRRAIKRENKITSLHLRSLGMLNINDDVKKFLKRKIIQKIIEEEKKKMLIQDLKDNMKNVIMIAEIIGKEEERKVLKCNDCKKLNRIEKEWKQCPKCQSKNIKIQRVSRARIKDKADEEANLDLWDENIEKVNIGDKIEIKGAMAKQFEYEENGKKITGFDIKPGYYGEIKVIE